MVQSHAPALTALKDLSVRLGTDITRTQGAGGNTSVKVDGTMWVKASGTWLKEALEKEIFVPVVVEPLVEALKAGDIRADKATDFIVQELNACKLRPSIETSVHAIMPQSVVAHFHCVNTIAHSVRADARECVAGRMVQLPHLRWSMVPYLRPGLPLAQGIAQVIHEAPDVVILRNHGIIVAGDSIDEVAERIETVTRALAIVPRESAPPDLDHLAALAAQSSFRLPAERDSHRVALDPHACRIAATGSLYPDHVIFLATRPAVLGEGESLDELLERTREVGRPQPKMIIVPGRGILVAEDLSAGGETMAQCLAEVALRIDPDARIDVLSDTDEYELTHWEAEKYRQKLDRASER